MKSSDLEILIQMVSKNSAESRRILINAIKEIQLDACEIVSLIELAQKEEREKMEKLLIAELEQFLSKERK